MEIKEWASLQTGGHLHCVTIMRHYRATSVFYLKHKTKRKRENETVKDGKRDLMREHEEMERWLGSHCYWEKRWVALGERNENVSIPPSSPSFLSRPPFPCSHLLISSHPFPFLIIISPPSSFISPAYLICIHLLTDLLCHKTANYLICLLPVSPPITSLPPTSVLASPYSLHRLPLCPPSPREVFPPCPACSTPPPSPPCSLGSLADSFRLVVWPLKNCWSNSAAHPIRNDSEGRKAEMKGRRSGQMGCGETTRRSWRTSWQRGEAVWKAAGMEQREK